MPPVPHDSHYYPPLQASHSNGYDANIYTTSTLAGVLMLMLRTYMFIRLVARSSVYHNASARVLAMGHNSNFEITPLVMLKGLLANNHGVIGWLTGNFRAMRASKQSSNDPKSPRSIRTPTSVPPLAWLPYAWPWSALTPSGPSTWHRGSCNERVTSDENAFS